MASMKMRMKATPNRPNPSLCMSDILLVGTNTTGVELLALDHLGLERRVMREQLNGTHLAFDGFHLFGPLCHASIIVEL